MGKLGAQPPRESHRVDNHALDNFLDAAVKLAAKHHIGVDSVIQARHILEMERTNDLRVAAGDFHDEHMGGFGDIFERIASALERREVD